jgi:hypothetical protein
MDIILSISSPSMFIGVAAYILYESLRKQDKVHWKRMGLAFILLICACISLVISIAAGASYGIIFIFFIASAAALLSGIFLGFHLIGWRKLTGILIGIGFPFVMFISIDLGMYFDPDSIIKRNGDTIIGALNEYHSDQGRYPEKLDDLVPTHLAELKEPGTMWGWLYIAEKENFTLGYVEYIDEWGYSICKYSAVIPEWDCIDDYSKGPYRSTEPFHLEPTPFPDPPTP